MAQPTDLSVKGRSRLPSSLAPTARKLLARLAVRGKNATYGQGFRVGRGAIISAPHHLTIGDWVSVGPNSIIQADGIIGDFCLIGMYVQIVGRDDHAVREVGTPISLATWVGDRPPTSRDAVDVGRDVWIGAGSIILSGVSIGEGSIVAAGSVVAQSIPAYSIAAGNPARVVSKRFADAALERQHREILDRLVEDRRASHDYRHSD